MKKILNLIIIALIIFTFISCDDEPNDRIVVGNQPMIIWQKKTVNKDAGKYEYWVTDETTYNWLFITNDEFYVGDTIKFTTK